MSRNDRNVNDGHMMQTDYVEAIKDGKPARLHIRESHTIHNFLSLVDCGMNRFNHLFSPLQFLALYKVEFDGKCLNFEEFSCPA